MGVICFINPNRGYDSPDFSDENNSNNLVLCNNTTNPINDNVALLKYSIEQKWTKSLERADNPEGVVKLYDKYRTWELTSGGNGWRK